MPIFAFIIILSFVFYIFYKVQYVRSRRPMEKKWLSAKSSIALGLFVSVFGLNTLFIQQTIVSYIIAAVFILIGGASVWAGIKAYRHFLPYARREAEELNNHS
ncbi:YtpI family protein [Bacillus thermotolerans]|uniref:Membrane Spanning Protein n=1 Tax=Bacillus thermotolerans TaxID=1221996 RepID=A0A0F5ICV9_BACTR|nr:YtpI family protein [Bacillus thermotolerans]KKB43293.1 putative Membrane Spanning Protein [Bacillus thermotolerans]